MVVKTERYFWSFNCHRYRRFLSPAFYFLTHWFSVGSTMSQARWRWPKESEWALPLRSYRPPVSPILRTLATHTALRMSFVHIPLPCLVFWRGTGFRELMRGMANLPQDYQELLMVKDKVERPPGEVGGKQVHGMWYFSIQCFDTVGWATGRASGL